MDVETIDKYMRGKIGVCVKMLDNAYNDGYLDAKYLLNDKMFARISFSENMRPFVTLKAKEKELEFLRTEFPEIIKPSVEYEPLHWNDIMLDCDMDDAVLLRSIDESYGIVFSALSEHAKRALDPNEPNYKYVFKKFDLAKIVNSTDGK